MQQFRKLGLFWKLTLDRRIISVTRRLNFSNETRECVCVCLCVRERIKNKKQKKKNYKCHINPLTTPRCKSLFIVIQWSLCMQMPLNSTNYKIWVNNFHARGLNIFHRLYYQHFLTQHLCAVFYVVEYLRVCLLPCRVNWHSLYCTLLYRNHAHILLVIVQGILINYINCNVLFRSVPFAKHQKTQIHLYNNSAQ